MKSMTKAPGMELFTGTVMDFLLRLTEYFEDQGIDDTEFSLEGTSYEVYGTDVIVYFPQIEV